MKTPLFLFVLLFIVSCNKSNQPQQDLTLITKEGFAIAKSKKELVQKIQKYLDEKNPSDKRIAEISKVEFIKTGKSQKYLVKVTYEAETGELGTTYISKGYKLTTDPISTTVSAKVPQQQQCTYMSCSVSCGSLMVSFDLFEDVYMFSCSGGSYGCSIYWNSFPQYGVYNLQICYE